jgi:uncharacterized membrane protein YcgQ (UPF0703/DUF1980 family)
MMKKISLFLLIITNLFFLSFVCYNGDRDYWELLETTKIKNKFNPETEEFDQVVKFLKKLKKLDGQKIQLKGFIVPDFFGREKVILSEFRNSRFTCCSLMSDIRRLVEIEGMDSVKFKIGEAVTLKGNLKLNTEDPFKFMYILENTKCLDCE